MTLYFLEMIIFVSFYCTNLAFWQIIVIWVDSFCLMCIKLIHILFDFIFVFYLFLESTGKVIPVVQL